MDISRLSGILTRLVSLEKETEWVEFKHNFYDPEDIGEYISAIANSAALHGEKHGYLVWGIEDGTRAVVGTDLRLAAKKVDQQDIEHWLSIHLRPKVDIRIHEFDFQKRFRMSLIEIPPAMGQPVRFREYEYIRVASHKKKLRDCSDKARALWDALSRQHFEDNTALPTVAANDVLGMLLWKKYFALLSTPEPSGTNEILSYLAKDKVITEVGGGFYDISNLGAMLFARRLSDFPRLGRKALRVIRYRGTDRTAEESQEQEGALGYAAGFEGAIGYIKNLLPANQVISEALRQELLVYPPLAVRELLANALIHQDFSISGTGPVVEIFEDRIEIRNPGIPFDPMDRIIDSPPRSRNEALANLMRRARICEERGSGLRKVIQAVELFQLPPPQFTNLQNHMQAVLFAPRSLSEMSAEERIRACYQHAVLLYVHNKKMNNESLRGRFSIEKANYSQASGIIKDTIDAGLIKPFGVNMSKKYVRYVPYWA